MTYLFAFDTLAKRLEYLEMDIIEMYDIFFIRRSDSFTLKLNQPTSQQIQQLLEIVGEK